MVEAMLLSLIVGLFIFIVFVLRMLTKRQISETLDLLIEDRKSEPASVAVDSAKSPLILQESTKAQN